jgi:hypothetical protein
MAPADPARHSWPLARAVIIVGLGWFALAWPWLSGRVTIPWDSKAHFQPQLQFLASALHSGQAPFWNPHVFAGSPQIADPQALIFSPPHLLLAAIVPEPGFIAADAVALGMLALGALGMLLIFRERGWHWTGAVVAALAFAFGGSAAWRVQHTGQVLSLAYLPLALFLLQRALDRVSWGWGFAAGVVAGIMVIGRDQVAWLNCWFLAGFVVWFVLSPARPLADRLAAWRPLLAGVAGGTLVAGLPLLWTVLLAGDSQRAAIDLVGAGRGSLHPASLLTIFSANLFGTDGPLSEFWGPPSYAWGPTDLYLARNMGDVYAGALVLLALLLGVVTGSLWRRDIRFVSVATVLTLLYALGWYTPVFRWMFATMPGADLFRRPADATFLLGFEAALLAGYIVGLLANGRLRPSAGAWAVTAAGVGVLSALCLGVALDKGRLAVALPRVAEALGWMALAALSLLLVLRAGTTRATLVTGLVAAAMVADLARNNGPNESTAMPPSTYDVLRRDTPNETIALIEKRLAGTAAPDRRDRVELAGVDFHWPNAGMVHGFDHTLGYNPIRLSHYAQATGAGDQIALPDQKVFSPLYPSYRSTLADLLGLRLVVTRIPVEEMDKQLRPGDLQLIGRTADGYVYENPRALPRVIFVPQAAPADFAAILRTGQWPTFDPLRTVLLEDNPSPATDGRPGTARLVDYRNTRVTVEADSPDGGWVVLADAWHPWWYAEVDGREAPVLRADVIFRAVRVPAGRHRIEFVFRPLRGALEELGERMQGSRAPSPHS